MVVGTRAGIYWKWLVCFLVLGVGLGLDPLYGRPRRRYDGHELIRVKTKTPDDIMFLRDLQKRNLQMQIWSSPTSSEEGGPAEIIVAPKHSKVVHLLLKANGLEYHVAVPDIQNAVEDQLAWMNEGRQTDGEFDFGKYHSWEEISQWLEQVAAAHSELVTLVPIAESVEGRTIKVVKISASSGERRPSIWLDAGIHSNEWVGPATMLYFINQLVSGYGNDRELMWLVDNLDWYILPVLNVDGYVYTWTEDRLWRKNRAVFGNGTCVGVDLNRNWPLHWGEGYADHDPCGRMYVGPEALSEPELRGVVDFLRAHSKDLRAYLAYHSFSQFWMLPYSYTKDKKPEHYREMLNMSQLAVSALHSVHGTTYQIGRISELIGEATGASVDYTYSTLGIKYSFGIELRDNGRHGTLLPSDQILPNAEESWVALKEVALAIIDQIYMEEGFTNI